MVTPAARLKETESLAIVCKSQSEIEKMRRSGHIVRQILDELKKMVAPGVTTMDLEKVAEQKIKEFGAKPAFKGYYDYPCVLCTSVNEEIVHGIPSAKRVLKAGDIVSIDGGVVLDGYYGDSALTVAVGEVSEQTKKLLHVTQESLELAIERVRLGGLGDARLSRIVDRGRSRGGGRHRDHLLRSPSAVALLRRRRRHRALLVLPRLHLATPVRDDLSVPALLGPRGSGARTEA